MTKAKRQMQEDMKLIDLVIELVDARVPSASRNPDIDELGKNKFRLIIMSFQKRIYHPITSPPENNRMSTIKARNCKNTSLCIATMI